MTPWKISEKYFTFMAGFWSKLAKESIRVSDLKLRLKLLTFFNDQSGKCLLRASEIQNREI